MLRLLSAPVLEKRLSSLHTDIKTMGKSKRNDDAEKMAKKSKKKKSLRNEDRKSDSGPKPGRDYTVSLALPGSIVDNAQSAELKTYLAGQVARACTIFNVDEVIVFSENGKQHAMEGEFSGVRRSDPNVFLARILQYLETPQYMRKSLFPVHPDLQYAGLLNPLDAPHHLRANEVSRFREGLTLNRPVKCGSGSFVNVGLKKVRNRMMVNDRVLYI